MSRPRPELPAAARLRQAARSYRLLATALRRANPGRRAASQHAEVDVAADGRVLALRVVSPGLVGAPLARHLLDLARAASGGAAAGVRDAITLTDLPGDHDQPSPGLGNRRFQLPADVDAQAPAPVMLLQLRATLQQRMAAAEQAAPRLATLVGEGEAAGGRIGVRVNSWGHLEAITLWTWTSTLPAGELNDAMAEALQRATEDLRRHTQIVLDGTVT